MTYTIDPASSTPPYEQLRQQLAERMASGELPAGMRLPTVRALAADLGLAPNTVARTYRELEHAGLTETRGRAGTFVKPHGAAEERALRLTHDYVQAMAALGITAEDAAERVRRTLT